MSALIHAATMVVAGVYLVARLYGVFFEGFSIDAGGINFVALIGGITVLMAAGLAFVQDDVKKVLAYSTVSQLGYMVMALGCGAWTAGVFHLFTHAFFKALLFLGSGSLIHAVHSNNMSEMGGLRKYMPTTYWTFLVGSLALAGIFPLAGFWSKDEILNGAGANGFPLFVVVGLVGAFMTAAYMTRACYLIFAGEYRGHGHPHESPPSMTWPLVILAVPACVAGLLNAPGIELVPPAGWSSRCPGAPEFLHAHAFNPALAVGSLAVAGLGIARRLPGLRPQRLAQGGDGPARRSWPTGYKVLVNKYYLDELFVNGIVRRSSTRSPRPPTGSTRTSSTAWSTPSGSGPARWPTSSTTTSTRRASTASSTAPAPAPRRAAAASATPRPARSSSTPPISSAPPRVLAVGLVVLT